MDNWECQRKVKAIKIFFGTLLKSIRFSEEYYPSLVHNFIGYKITQELKQDSGDVGGHGVLLSSWIYQEYTFRLRSAAESGQEYPMRGKEYIEPHKTW